MIHGISAVFLFYFMVHFVVARNEILKGMAGADLVGFQVKKIKDKNDMFFCTTQFPPPKKKKENTQREIYTFRRTHL